jgi:tripartite-type tricarboxylate transporter receptor subunit TctC
MATVDEFSRRTLLKGGAAAGAGMFLAACAKTGSSGSGKSSFPTRQVEFIIPFAPGGSTDLIGRTSTKQIRGPLGQPMIVVNKAGAAGAVGTKDAVTASADGYKLALAPTSLFTITPLVKKESTGLELAGMDIVTGLTLENVVLVVHKDSPYKTIDDLLKAKGKTLTFGHSGVGSAPHFAATMFFKQAGVAAKDVPFDGSGPAVNALLGQQVDVAPTHIAESIKQVQAGTLRQLVIFSAERSTLLPDVPTARESGIDFTVDQLRFVATAKGTPAEVLLKLKTSFLESTKDAEYDAFLKKMFIERAELNADQIRAKITTDLQKYQELAKQHGISPA